MAKNPTTIRLGKNDVQLRYDQAAIQELDELGINIYSPASYVEFNPVRLKNLVWAGQLYTEKPLTKAQVVEALPLKLGDYAAIAKAIAAAIKEAIYDTVE